LTANSVAAQPAIHLPRCSQSQGTKCEEGYPTKRETSAREGPPGLLVKATQIGNALAGNAVTLTNVTPWDRWDKKRHAWDSVTEREKRHAVTRHPVLSELCYHGLMSREAGTPRAGWSPALRVARSLARRIATTTTPSGG
jgi:hypothetical protein